LQQEAEEEERVVHLTMVAEAEEELAAFVLLVIYQYL
jgi:hypothetical protein